MNILVTGGSGTIGGYMLRELLCAGHTVSSYSRSPPLVEGVEFVDGDITRLEQLRDITPSSTWPPCQDPEEPRRSN